MTTATRTKRRTISGTIEACGHLIDWWMEIDNLKNTEHLREWLERDTEEHVREMIAEDYTSGQLCSLYRTPVQQREHDLYGWWDIR